MEAFQKHEGTLKQWLVNVREVVSWKREEVDGLSAEVEKLKRDPVLSARLSHQGKLSLLQESLKHAQMAERILLHLLGTRKQVVALDALPIATMLTKSRIVSLLAGLDHEERNAVLQDAKLTILDLGVAEPFYRCLQILCPEDALCLADEAFQCKENDYDSLSDLTIQHIVNCLGDSLKVFEENEDMVYE